MQEHFVPYGIALELKKRGFTETTLGHYYERDNQNSLVVYGEYPPDNTKGWTPAPLLQQAVDFFLSKGVYVGVSDFPIYNGYFGYRYGRGTASGYTPHMEGKTRRDALINAMVEAMYLIKSK